jgi:hypothetical protein
LHRSFSCLWVADGSTLEAIQKRMDELKETAGCVLGGKMMAVVDLLSLCPVEVFYDEESSASEYSFLERLRALLPVGGLLVLDRGFFDFAFFDACTEQDPHPSAGTGGISGASSAGGRTPFPG